MASKKQGEGFSQFYRDANKLAGLIHQFTDIPEKELRNMFQEQGVRYFSKKPLEICRTQAQWDNLTALFDFKALYDTLRKNGDERGYVINKADAAKAFFRVLLKNRVEKEYFYAAFVKEIFSRRPGLKHKGVDFLKGAILKEFLRRLEAENFKFTQGENRERARYGMSAAT
jgi:hypothetical protein